MVTPRTGVAQCLPPQGALTEEGHDPVALWEFTHFGCLPTASEHGHLLAFRVHSDRSGMGTDVAWYLGTASSPSLIPCPFHLWLPPSATRLQTQEKREGQLEVSVPPSFPPTIP